MLQVNTGDSGQGGGVRHHCSLRTDMDGGAVSVRGSRTGSPQTHARPPLGAFAPVSRMNAPLSGFRHEHGTCPRRSEKAVHGPSGGAFASRSRTRRPFRQKPFTPTAMGGICLCGPNKRPSERFSSRTWKVVRIGRRSPSTGRLDSLALNHGDHVHPPSGGNTFFPKTESLRTSGTRPYHL